MRFTVPSVPIPPIVLSLLILGGYLFCLSENLSIAHDSISYFHELFLLKNPSFHPHHLLYFPTLIFWSDAGTWLGIEHPLFWAESLNAIAGASLLFILYLILNQHFDYTKSRTEKGVILIAASYGIWAYSILLEVYIIPLAILFLSIYILGLYPKKTWTLWLAALTHCLAILYHQSHVLWLLPACWFIYANSSKWNALFQYAGLVSGLSFLIYLLAGWTEPGVDSFRDWMAWMMGYTLSDHFWQFPNPIDAAIGFGRSWIGGHFLFGMDAFSLDFFQGHRLENERFLVRNLPYSGLIALGIGGLLVASTLVYAFINGCRHYFRIEGASKQWYRLFGLGFIVYSLFFLFWVPVNPEFWLCQSIFCLPLILLGLKKRGLILNLLIWFLFFVNMGGSIGHLKEKKNDLYAVQAAELGNLSNQADLILLENSWMLGTYGQIYWTAESLHYDQWSQDSTEQGLIRHIQAVQAIGGKVLYPNVEAFDFISLPADSFFLSGHQSWKIIR